MDCLFCKIAEGTIPSKAVFQDDRVYAFADINPQAPVHILVIPKGAYCSLDDFSTEASEAEIAAFLRAVGAVARAQGLDESGYRILANHGRDSHHEVPHFHVQIFGGRPLGRMISKA